MISPVKNHRFLLGGFDTQAFTVDLGKYRLRMFPFDFYDGVKNGCRAEGGKGEVFNIAGIGWQVYPTKGLWGAYDFYSDYGKISVYPPGLPRRPVVWVYGKGVAQFGIDSMHKKVVAFFSHHHVPLRLSEYGEGSEGVDALVLFRQDWNAIFAVPSVEIIEKDFLPTGLKTKPWKGVDGKIETLYLGERTDPVFLRVYDKLRKIEEFKTYWELDVLRANGLRDGEQVLCVEVQMNKAFLKSSGWREWDDMAGGGGNAIARLFSETFVQGKRGPRGRITLTSLWNDVVALALGCVKASFADWCEPTVTEYPKRLANTGLDADLHRLQALANKVVARSASEGRSVNEVVGILQDVVAKSINWNTVEATQKKLGIFRRGVGLFGADDSPRPPLDGAVSAAERANLIVQQALDDGSGVPF